MTAANGVDRARQAVAYHEAGHAAVAFRLGRSVLRVEITPGGPDREGLCVHSSDDPAAEFVGIETGDEVAIRDRVAVCLAGQAAEIRAGFADMAEVGECGDFIDAVDFVSSLCCPDHDAELAACWSRANELVAGPEVWAGVEALAAELVRAGSVSGDEVHRILTAAGIRPGVRGER